MGNRKYSENFERDYNWYLKYKNVFIFSGTIPESFNVNLENGLSAKECFYIRDTYGKIKFSKIETKEPELLADLIKCKESINFQIKQWVEEITDYNPFGFINIDFFLNEKDLVWNKDGTFKEMSIMEQYELLPWMVKAIKNQIDKLVKNC